MPLEWNVPKSEFPAHVGVVILLFAIPNCFVKESMCVTNTGNAESHGQWSWLTLRNRVFEY